ncbi:hypothetical protein CRUP_011901, partial [Coryphaenoides rupestris]
GRSQHSVYFQYTPGDESLSAILSQSEGCEQELTYYCRKSRLLNTLGGSPFSWWSRSTSSNQGQTQWVGVSPGTQHWAGVGSSPGSQQWAGVSPGSQHWVGSSAGSQLCACGLQHDCLDTQHHCNCDSKWANVSGLLTQKEMLPVRSLVLGDNLWNAASFDKETSYLHFPTFHAELSADISFLFKTTASSGVFLENLGIKDFLRIELTCNGPTDVRVTSSGSLSDGRWHRVRAERNVKEAWLHKGFRGCIRSLRLNGETLDLEERARVSPGVRPGCPGHCSSYGALCRNQGRCVSASFTTATSIHYTFQETREPGRNDSGRQLPASRGESVLVAFSTRHSPALLLYVTATSISQYLALLLNQDEELEVRYKLGSEAVAVRTRVRKLADGRIHTLTVRRRAHRLSVQIDQHSREDFDLTSDVDFHGNKSLFLGRIYNTNDLDPLLSRYASVGFTGCLSVVQFNTISPLKVALFHRDSSPVTITGPFSQSNCGSSSPANPHAAETTYHLSGQPGSVNVGQPLVNAIRADSTLIGGAIAVVVFVVVSALAIVARLLYGRKETFQSQGIAPGNWCDASLDPRSDRGGSQRTSGESQQQRGV